MKNIYVIGNVNKQGKAKFFSNIGIGRFHSLTRATLDLIKYTDKKKAISDAVKVRKDNLGIMFVYQVDSQTLELYHRKDIDEVVTGKYNWWLRTQK